MIKSRIQIGDGAVQDFYEAFGFIYLDADERHAPPEKKPDSTSNVNEPGEHQDTRRVPDAFDYTATFLVEAPNKNLQNVNSKITAFNNAVREAKQGSSAYRRCKEIAFYNLLNRVKIVGYPELISEAKEVYRSNEFGAMDFAEVELKIRVSDPTKCVFDLTLNEPAHDTSDNRT